MNRTSARAFTLIELLIVVAIIAILAAIAVPNFLEAQTRAKVSRARADMRSVATALEAYCVDNNGYPPNPDRRENRNVIPWRLTTPVGYISTLPQDPFKIGKKLTEQILDGPAAPRELLLYDYFTIISGEEAERLDRERGLRVFAIAIDLKWPDTWWPWARSIPSWPNAGATMKYGKWLMWSRGPDGIPWLDRHRDEYPDFIPYTEPYLGLLRDPLDPLCVVHQRWGYSFDVAYDPTNGTSSFGNVTRTASYPEGSQVLPPLPCPNDGGISRAPSAD